MGGRVGGQAGEQGDGYVYFDDAAGWAVAADTGGAVAGVAFGEQGAFGVGDGEAPLGAGLLGDS